MELKESKNYKLVFDLENNSEELHPYRLLNKNTEFTEISFDQYPAALELMVKFEDAIVQLDKMLKDLNKSDPPRFELVKNDSFN